MGTIMYFHQLNKKEIQEMRNDISKANKTGFLAGVDTKVRDHIINCKECEKQLDNYSGKIADVILNKKFMKLADNMTFTIEKHSGLKVDPHCSIESVAKQCSCLGHQLDKEHCCNCEPEKCIKKMQWYSIV